MKQRVIALGSPFGADRAAWSVVDDLRGKVPTDVELVALDRPGAALITWLRADLGITLIDAALGCPAGSGFVEVRRVDLASRNRIDSHHEQLADTLALADTLGRLPRQLAIFAIDIVAEEQLDARSVPAQGVQALTHFLANKLNQCGPKPSPGGQPSGPSPPRKRSKSTKKRKKTLP